MHIEFTRIMFTIIPLTLNKVSRLFMYRGLLVAPHVIPGVSYGVHYVVTPKVIRAY